MSSPFEAVHEDLKALKQFCIQTKKQPYIRDGELKNSFTSSGWPEHRQNWLTFAEAVDATQRGVKVYHDGAYRRVEGIGFLVGRNGQEGPQTSGGDLDCCRDPKTGQISPWATAFLQQVRPFYSEASPSKCGLRFFAWGRLPGGRDKVFGNGPQDDLPEDSRERILTAKPKAREKLAKGEPAFNGLEMYESGRHLTLTGWKIDDLCFTKEDQSRAISEALEPFLVDEVMGRVADDVKRVGRGGLPRLDILDVINTNGFNESGGQLFGSHPTLGSTTGRNLVVNPSKNVYCYMHNGIDAGGDPWIWLACECGAVPWERVGSGVLKDRSILEKTLKHAVSRGLISEEEAGLKSPIRAAHVDAEHFTEGGNASRLIRLHGQNMRYCHTYKKWLVWNGRRWKIDGNGEALRMAADVVRELYQFAVDAEDKSRNEIASFARFSDRKQHLQNVLGLASCRLPVAITADALDTNPWLAVVGDVVINLLTLETKKPVREDLCTKALGASYDQDATCPRWDAFLWEIFAGNENLIRYVQRAVGYSLSGSMDEQVFFFLYGLGSNGKSVFLAVLRALMGDFARQASFATFLTQRNDRVRNDLAALAGVRVITAGEAEEGSRFSMSTIKPWTGQDPITARFLFGEDFTFRPEAKLWFAANTRPAISERTPAAWRRVHLIPFSVVIPKEKQDPILEQKLLAELPGILQWALIGLKEYHEEKLAPPQEVLAATNEYRRENDSLQGFIGECCAVHNLALCRNSELFGTYQAFCRDTGHEPLSQKKFSEELKLCPGIHQTRDRTVGMIWHGICVKDCEGSNQDAVKDRSENTISSSCTPRVCKDTENPSHPSHASPDNDLENSNPSQAEENGPKTPSLGRQGVCQRSEEPAKVDTSEAKIKAAAISEFGLSGWVDPRKIALFLKLPLGEVEAWLQANYTAFERSGGGIGYRQRRAGEAPA